MRDAKEAEFILVYSKLKAFMSSLERDRREQQQNALN